MINTTVNTCSCIITITLFLIIYNCIYYSVQYNIKYSTIVYYMYNAYSYMYNYHTSSFPLNTDIIDEQILLTISFCVGSLVVAYLTT